MVAAVAVWAGYSAGLSKTPTIARNMAITIHHTMRQAVQSPVPRSSLSYRCVINVVLWFIQHSLRFEVAVLRFASRLSIDYRGEVLANSPTVRRTFQEPFATSTMRPCYLDFRSPWSRLSSLLALSDQTKRGGGPVLDCRTDQRKRSHPTAELKPKNHNARPASQWFQFIPSAERGNNNRVETTTIAKPAIPIRSIHRIILTSTAQRIKRGACKRVPRARLVPFTTASNFCQ
jgi:hypothetical protein